ncbi:hypothetical protein [Corynebacterium bovis]|uniref:hypothetical protein n=1 Tax=Corynebacterium bovis TaxID=36808 RepID=UPI00313A43FE
MYDQILASVDHISSGVSYFAQSVPGEGGGMEAPPGFDAVANRIVGAAKYVGIFVTVIAIIAAFGGAAISRQRGNSEEATERFLTIGLAISGIVMVTTIVAWIISAAQGG